MPIPEKIIDAHHHLWDLRACHYPWLMTKGVHRFFGDPTPIQKNYLVSDFIADIGELPVKGSVHVQVGVDERQSVNETRWLQSVADSNNGQNNGQGFPHAIVAYCDLSANNALSQLREHKKSSRLRSIRQIIGRSPEEDKHTGGLPFLTHPVWQANLSSLADLQLAFDLQLIPAYMSAACKTVANTPATQIALCHCGSPFDQSKKGIAFWRAELKKLAELPNIYCKISGFGMFDHNWTTDSIREIVESVIELFTPQRCMFGSNFPVDKLYCQYPSLWASYFQLSESYSADEKDQLFYKTAKEFYSIAENEY